jgi:hypothetical protein
VDDDIEKRKLDAIVGAAIKALAESGAGDELVGAFAATHRLKVSKILGLSEPAADAPDLLDIVTQAVGMALEQAGVGKRKVFGGPSTKRVYVEVGGRRTSLTLSHAVLGKLDQVRGERKAAKTIIQELANSAPSNVENRSGWVEERLTAYLQLGQDKSQGARH